MKNQEQTNNNNNLNDPTVANDPQAQVEFDDLPISGEQEERVKGGGPGGHVKVFSGTDGSPLRRGDGDDVLISFFGNDPM